jgi:hypothetical protein
VGIITAAKFLPNSNGGNGAEFLLLALVCLCSIGIYWFAAIIWKGGETKLTGTPDIDVLYESYIGLEKDTAYCNFLADLCSAFEDNQKDNQKRGNFLDMMVFSSFYNWLSLP